MAPNGSPSRGRPTNYDGPEEPLQLIYDKHMPLLIRQKRKKDDLSIFPKVEPGNPRFDKLRIMRDMMQALAVEDGDWRFSGPQSQKLILAWNRSNNHCPIKGSRSWARDEAGKLWTIMRVWEAAANDPDQWASLVENVAKYPVPSNRRADPGPPPSMPELSPDIEDGNDVEPAVDIAPWMLKSLAHMIPQHFAQHSQGHPSARQQEHPAVAGNEEPQPAAPEETQPPHKRQEQPQPAAQAEEPQPATQQETQPAGHAAKGDTGAVDVSLENGRPVMKTEAGHKLVGIFGPLASPDGFAMAEFPGMPEPVEVTCMLWKDLPQEENDEKDEEEKLDEEWNEEGEEEEEDWNGEEWNDEWNDEWDGEWNEEWNDEWKEQCEEGDEQATAADGDEQATAADKGNKKKTAADKGRKPKTADPKENKTKETAAKKGKKKNSAKKGANKEGKSSAASQETDQDIPVRKRPARNQDGEASGECERKKRALRPQQYWIQLRPEGTSAAAAVESWRGLSSEDKTKFGKDTREERGVTASEM